MRKYELAPESRKVGRETLYRIRALRDFGDVRAGDLGGYVDSEYSLAQDGLCWVANSACVYQAAQVAGDARVSGSAHVAGCARVYGSARVSAAARVTGCAEVYEAAHVHGEAQIAGKARVFGSAQVHGSTYVLESAQVHGSAQISDHARVFAHVSGDARVFDYAQIYDSAHICGSAWVFGDAHVYGDAHVSESARVFGCARILGRARVCGNARVAGNAIVNAAVRVWDEMWLSGAVKISDGYRMVLHITGSKHFLYLYGSGKVMIGCITLPLEEWLRTYREEGEQACYTPAQIKEYGDYLRMADAAMSATPAADDV